MPTLWWYVRDQSWRNSGHHTRNLLKTLQKMDFRGGDDDAVFFHQLTLLDSKQGFSSLRPSLLSEVNYLKTQIKCSYVTNWHELARSFHWGHSGGGIWRELREELEIEISIIESLGSYPDVYGEDSTPTINIFYLANIVAGIPTARSDVSEVQWFNRNKIPSNIAFECVRWAINTWLELSSSGRYWDRVFHPNPLLSQATKIHGSLVCVALTCPSDCGLHTLIHTFPLKNPLPHFVLDSLGAEVWIKGCNAKF
jgi:hypothetical protein